MAKKKDATAATGNAGQSKKKKKQQPQFRPVGLVTLLHKASRKELDDVLQCMNSTGRAMLYKCAFNCVYNPTVSEFKRAEMIKKLSKSAKSVELLADPDLADDKKKRVLMQKGGFLLPLLLSAAIPLLQSLFGGGGGGQSAPSS